MARTEHTAGIPVLLRSMFEAITDLDWAVGWMLQSAEYVHDAFRTPYSAAEVLREHESLR